MLDIFNEQLLKKYPSSKDKMYKVLIIVVGILLMLIGLLFLPQILPVIVLAAGYGIYYFVSYLNIEYEYIFTNGDLDIDCIYNKSKRKHKFSCDIKNIEIMCRVNDKVNIGKFQNAQETKDFSSGRDSNNVFCFLISQDGKNIKVLIEPNENMLNGFSKYLTPRKLIK